MKMNSAAIGDSCGAAARIDRDVTDRLLECWIGLVSRAVHAIAADDHRLTTKRIINAGLILSCAWRSAVTVYKSGWPGST